MAEGAPSDRWSRILEVVKLLPPLLWILLAFYVARVLIMPTVEAVRRGQGVELRMSEFTLKVVEQRLETANRLGSKAMSAADAQVAFGPLADRIGRSRRQLSGATVLWVDDRHPMQNAYERRAIGALGVAIDTARSTEEAMALLDEGLPYDAVISDLSRPGQPAAPCQKGSIVRPQAGCDLIARLRARCGDAMPPTIFYSASMQPDYGTPAYSFGMTNRVDQLVLLLLDALERRPEAQATGGTTDPGPEGTACRGSPLPPPDAQAGGGPTAAQPGAGDAHD